MKIEVKNVSKKFKDVSILEDINVVFESGKIYGIVGINGSGKSVFLKMLCALYNPSYGEILFDNVNIIKNKLFPPDTRAMIEAPSFIPDLTGYQNLELLVGIQNKIKKEQILESLEQVGLLEEKDKKYGKYSLGMKQKLGIVQVLMENPKVMIFDEPFNGIDEKTISSIENILKLEVKKDKIIIIASHVKDEIIKLSDEIYLFENKKIRKINRDNL